MWGDLRVWCSRYRCEAGRKRAVAPLIVPGYRAGRRRDFRAVPRALAAIPMLNTASIGCGSGAAMISCTKHTHVAIRPSSSETSRRSLAWPSTSRIPAPACWQAPLPSFRRRRTSREQHQPCDWQSCRPLQLVDTGIEPTFRLRSLGSVAVALGDLVDELRRGLPLLCGLE
jgi:hypothetical protein